MLYKESCDLLFSFMLYLNPSGKLKFDSFILQVPLAIFKREKEIARSLEFDGMWITEEPSKDDFRNQWDRLAISTRYETSPKISCQQGQA